MNRAATPTTPPLDVRLMHGAAAALALLALGLLMVAALLWAAARPGFVINQILVSGDTQHQNEVALRTQLAGKISGSYLGVNLHAVRAAFETLPWVRSASVRREFPNRVRVSLSEHQVAALWGADNDSRLVNQFGEIFEASASDAELDGLPRLLGPTEQAPELLSTWRALSQSLATLNDPIAQLKLSDSGAWSAELTSGAQLKLGRGSQQDLQQRARQFAQTLPTVAARHQLKARDLEAADLRHPQGYALRLRGLTTLTP